jgi:hypothetical protein
MERIMKFNQDEMMLDHNTFGDRFEIWVEGERFVTIDLDSDKSFMTYHSSITAPVASDLLIQALAAEVMRLEALLEDSR